MRALVPLALLALVIVAASAQSNFPVSTWTSVAVTNGGVYGRSYSTNQYFGGRVVASLGLRAGATNTSAAADATVFVASTFLDCAVALGYVAGAASWSVSANGQQLNVNWAAAALAAGVRFFKILEFQDLNGVAGYQPGSSDKVVGYYSLQNLITPWNPFSYTTSTIAGGGTLYVVSANTQDNVFGFRVSVASTSAVTGAYRLDPSTLKIDVLINYFNNTQFTGPVGLFAVSNGPSNIPGTKIALVTGLGAAAAGASNVVGLSTSADPLSNPGVVAANVRAGTTSVFLNYSPKADFTVSGVAIAGGAVYQELASSDPDPTQGGDAGTGLYAGWAAWTGGRALAIYSYDAPRPSRIYWDPVMSVQNPGTTQATSSASLPSTAFLAAVVAAAALLL